MSDYSVELLTADDMDSIMGVIDDAKAFLKGCGLDQWQDGYPDKAVIQHDIETKISYGIKDKQRVVAYLALSQHDVNYDMIDGKWLDSHEHYYALHRLCVLQAYGKHGLATQLFTFAKLKAQNDGFNSLRIDTHPDNIAMQRAINKQDFQYCGKIWLERGDALRYAYEWVCLGK